MKALWVSWTRLWVTGLLAVLCCGVWAQPFQRLDDSTSPRTQVEAPRVVDEQGQPLATSPGAQVAILAFGWIDYRLATAPYVGRKARIYYELPASIPGLRSPMGLDVNWKTRGRFASGSARPGERVLVWSGVVQEAWMQESIDLTARLNLRDLQPRPGSGFGFDSYFVIEVLP